MRLVKLAVASVNSTVGAVRENVGRMLKIAQQAHEEQAAIVVFPEQAIGGYSPEDLVQWRAYVAS